MRDDAEYTHVTPGQDMTVALKPLAKRQGPMIRTRFRITLTGLTASALLLGCGESTTPLQTTRPPVDGPRSTAAVGFTGTTVARGNAGVFDVLSEANGYKVRIRTASDTDIAVSNIVQVPGGSSGWHSHPGLALVVVKTGTLTFYRADGHGQCSVTVYPAGSAFVEGAGEVHIARNEGSTDVTLTVTFVGPAGGATRIDQPAPGGHCPP